MVTGIQFTYPKTPHLPGAERASFKLTWSNGVVMTGALGDVLLQRDPKLS